MKKLGLFLLVGMTALVVGCSTPSNTSTTYDRSAMTSTQRTITGKIVSKRVVTVKGGTGVGSSAGAGIGAIAGGNLGGDGSDSAVGAIAGAVIGGTVGAIAESEAFATDALEYVVESNVAGLLTVVMTDSGFEVGDDVFIVMGRTPKLIRKPK